MTLPWYVLQDIRTYGLVLSMGFRLWLFLHAATAAIAAIAFARDLQQDDDLEKQAQERGGWRSFDQNLINFHQFSNLT